MPRMVITVEVFAPRPANLTAILSNHLHGYETTPATPGAGYAVIVPLTDGEEPVDVVGRIGGPLRWPLGQRLAWTDPWDLAAACEAGKVINAGLPAPPAQA